MKNYKLKLAYDGSRYKGWQRLGNGEPTIQETIETAIEKVLGYAVEIHGSGRTDAGVHAREQVANMKVSFRLQEDFVFQVNKHLPDDIRVLCVEQVPGNFHARYNAIGKTYCYYVDTKDKPDVFERKYRYHFPYQLNVTAMQSAAIYLTGKHDFSSFTDDKTEGKDKLRAIYEIQIMEQEGVISFWYRGNGFLQHMVRIMTGTLLEVGRGDMSSDDVLMILREKNRAKAGFLVPAKGLFLDSVKYEQED